MKLPHLLIAITLLTAIFQLPQVQPLLIWNIDLIESGQWWRIVSGNLTHTNSIHLLMNLTALWIIAYLFRPVVKSFAVAIIVLSAVVGGLLLCFNFHTYAGLSGVLHGLFAFYALSEALNGRQSSWLMVVGVCVKIGYEQLYGASESTANLINAAVATEAHLVGGITGILLAVGFAWFNRGHLS